MGIEQFPRVATHSAETVVGVSAPSFAEETEEQNRQNIGHSLFVAQCGMIDGEDQKKSNNQILHHGALEEQEIAERARTVLPDHHLDVMEGAVSGGVASFLSDVCFNTLSAEKHVHVSGTRFFVGSAEKLELRCPGREGLCGGYKSVRIRVMSMQSKQRRQNTPRMPVSERSH